MHELVRAVDAAPLDRQVQQQQAQELVEIVVAEPAREHGTSSRSAGGAVVAEALDDRVLGVAGGAQLLAERGRRFEVGYRVPGVQSSASSTRAWPSISSRPISGGRSPRIAAQKSSSSAR